MTFCKVISNREFFKNGEKSQHMSILINTDKYTILDVQNILCYAGAGWSCCSNTGEASCDYIRELQDRISKFFPWPDAWSWVSHVTFLSLSLDIWTMDRIKLTYLTGIIKPFMILGWRSWVSTKHYLFKWTLASSRKTCLFSTTSAAHSGYVTLKTSALGGMMVPCREVIVDMFLILTNTSMVTGTVLLSGGLPASLAITVR